MTDPIVTYITIAELLNSMWKIIKLELGDFFPVSRLALMSNFQVIPFIMNLAVSKGKYYSQVWKNKQK